MKNQEKTTNPVLAWLILGILALTWGSSFILIKKGLEVFSADQVAGIRIGVSFLVFLPIFIWKFKDIDWSKWKAILVVGFIGSFMPAFLFAYAQTELSSSITGILNSLTPLFTLLIGILFFRMPMIWVKVLGVVIGLFGALFLIYFNQDSADIGNPLYGLLVALAAVFYATSSNVIKHYLQEIDSVIISAVSFFFIGVPGVIWLFSTNFVQVMETTPFAWQAFGYVALLGLSSTAFGSYIYFKLVQLTSPVFASMVAYLIPMIALGWGIFDGEQITIFHFIGMSLILIGVYFSRKEKI